MIRLKQFVLLTGVCMLTGGCEFKCQVGNTSNSTGSKGSVSTPVMKNGTAIYNNIELNSDGFQVKKAYLIYNDNGERLPEGNFYEQGRKVALVLEGISGWSEKNGMVNGGASQMIVAGEKDTLLNAPDLFAENYPNGMDAKDANVIRFTATVKLEKDRPAVSLTVFFRVWDKSGTASVNGKVTLLTK